MTMTGLKVVDETVHATNGWLHEIDARMGWDDRQKGWRLLRVSLHALRDRLPPVEAAQFSAQLPILLRGVFYEGWRPADTPKKTRDVGEFLSGVAAAFSEDAGFEPEAAFREVIDVMKLHISEGEMEDVRRAMPEAIRALWNVETFE